MNPIQNIAVSAFLTLSFGMSSSGCGIIHEIKPSTKVQEMRGGDSVADMITQIHGANKCDNAYTMQRGTGQSSVVYDSVRDLTIRLRSNKSYASLSVFPGNLVGRIKRDLFSDRKNLVPTVTYVDKGLDGIDTHRLFDRSVSGDSVLLSYVPIGSIRNADVSYRGELSILSDLVSKKCDVFVRYE